MANLAGNLSGGSTGGTGGSTPLPPVTLTDGATISLTASAGSVFRVTLGGNRTLAAPTSPTDGQMITIAIKQDATGGRTLALTTGAGGFSFGTDAPVGAFSLSTVANAVDYLTCVYNEAALRWHVVGLIRGF